MFLDFFWRYMSAVFLERSTGVLVIYLQISAAHYLCQHRKAISATKVSTFIANIHKRVYLWYSFPPDVAACFRYPHAELYNSAQ